MQVRAEWLQRRKTASKGVPRKAARNPEVHDVTEAKGKNMSTNYAECCLEGE